MTVVLYTLALFGAVYLVIGAAMVGLAIGASNLIDARDGRWWELPAGLLLLLVAWPVVLFIDP